MVGSNIVEKNAIRFGTWCRSCMWCHCFFGWLMRPPTHIYKYTILPHYFFREETGLEENRTLQIL